MTVAEFLLVVMGRVSTLDDPASLARMFTSAEAASVAVLEVLPNGRQLGNGKMRLSRWSWEPSVGGGTDMEKLELLIPVPSGLPLNQIFEEHPFPRRAVPITKAESAAEFQQEIQEAIANPCFFGLSFQRPGHREPLLLSYMSIAPFQDARRLIFAPIPETLEECRRLAQRISALESHYLKGRCPTANAVAGILRIKRERVLADCGQPRQPRRQLALEAAVNGHRANGNGEPEVPMWETRYLKLPMTCLSGYAMKGLRSIAQGVEGAVFQLCTEDDRKQYLMKIEDIYHHNAAPDSVARHAVFDPALLRLVSKENISVPLIGGGRPTVWKCDGWLTPPRRGLSIPTTFGFTVMERWEVPIDSSYEGVDDLLRQSITEKLNRLHQLGYIHGDINGGNIMLKYAFGKYSSEGEETKIAFIDFGQTKKVADMTAADTAFYSSLWTFFLDEPTTVTKKNAFALESRILKNLLDEYTMTPEEIEQMWDESNGHRANGNGEPEVPMWKIRYLKLPMTCLKGYPMEGSWAIAQGEEGAVFQLCMEKGDPECDQYLMKIEDIHHKHKLAEPEHVVHHAVFNPALLRLVSKEDISVPLIGGGRPAVWTCDGWLTDPRRADIPTTFGFTVMERWNVTVDTSYEGVDDLLRQSITEKLDRLHQLGYVHGDIHGANIMLKYAFEVDETTKIAFIDFGQSKKLADLTEEDLAFYSTLWSFFLEVPTTVTKKNAFALEKRILTKLLDAYTLSPEKLERLRASLWL